MQELQLAEDSMRHWAVLHFNALIFHCLNLCLSLARADASRQRGVSAASGAVSCENAGSRSWVWLQGQCWGGGDTAISP